MCWGLHIPQLRPDQAWLSAFQPSARPPVLGPRARTRPAGAHGLVLLCSYIHQDDREDILRSRDAVRANSLLLGLPSHDSGRFSVPELVPAQVLTRVCVLSGATNEAIRENTLSRDAVSKAHAHLCPWHHPEGGTRAPCQGSKSGPGRPSEH